MPEKLLLHSVLKLENIVKKQTQKIAIITYLELNFFTRQVPFVLRGHSIQNVFKKPADIGFEDFYLTVILQTLSKGTQRKRSKTILCNCRTIRFSLK